MGLAHAGFILVDLVAFITILEQRRFIMVVLGAVVAATFGIAFGFSLIAVLCD